MGTQNVLQWLGETLNCLESKPRNPEPERHPKKLEVWKSAKLNPT